jgi:hypothetical protein
LGHRPLDPSRGVAENPWVHGDSPGSIDDPSIEARYAELQQKFAGIGDPKLRQDVIEDALRDELAREGDLDPALLEAVSMIHEHGFRGARKLVNNFAYRSMISQYPGDSLERNDRIAAYLDEWRSEFPWWKRLLT